MTEKPDRYCRNCGELESKHKLANFADGQQVGETFLVCPKHVFDPKEYYDDPPIDAKDDRPTDIWKDR